MAGVLATARPPMNATYDLDATIAGVDASRRVAWARFYASQRDCAALLRHNVHLLRHLARLALAVSRSEAVRVFDPDLAQEARRVIAAMRARARGRAILAEYEQDVADE